MRNSDTIIITLVLGYYCVCVVVRMHVGNYDRKDDTEYFRHSWNDANDQEV